MVAPKAVRAAERTLASGSSASFSRTAVDGLDVPSSDEIDQHQPAVARSRLQPCGQQVVDFLGGKIGQDVDGRCRDIGVDIECSVQKHGSAGCVARLFQPSDRGDPHLAGSGLGGLKQGVAGLGVGTIGQGQQQQGLPRRRRLAQLGQQGVGHFRCGNLPGQLQAQGEPLLVGRLQEIDQQREPGRTSGDNRAADAFEDPVLGHVGLAHQVVETNGLILLPFGQVLFRTADDRIGDLAADRRRCGGQRLFQGLGRRIAADASQRRGGRRSHVRVGIAEPCHQRVDRLGVAPHSDRIDHADQQAAFQAGLGLPQRLVAGRIGNRFQGDPGPGRKLFVGQIGRDGRHRVLVSEHGQRLEGFHLFGLGRVGLKQGDQLGRLDRRRSAVVCRLGRDGGHERGGQQDECIGSSCSSPEGIAKWRFEGQVLSGAARFPAKPQAAHTRHGSRSDSDRSRLASSSPGNSFFTGS